MTKNKHDQKSYDQKSGHLPWVDKFPRLLFVINKCSTCYKFLLVCFMQNVYTILLWSDSSFVLHWIYNNKTIENRLRAEWPKILKFTKLTGYRNIY